MKDILCNELTLLKILLEIGHLLPESLELLSPLVAIHCPTVTAHVVQMDGCCMFSKLALLTFPH